MTVEEMMSYAEYEPDAPITDAQFFTGMAEICRRLEAQTTAIEKLAEAVRGEGK